MFQAQADSAIAAKVGKDAKEKFDEADIDFRRQRSELAILMNELSKKLMSDAGADWNYPEQMGPIRRRFMRDFRDGLYAPPSIERRHKISICTLTSNYS